MYKPITKENLKTAVKTYLTKQFGKDSTSYTKDKLTQLENRSALSRLFHASGAEGYLRAHKVLKLLLEKIEENNENYLLLLTLAIMKNNTGETLKNTIAESLGYKETAIVAGSGIGSVGALFSPSDNLASDINKQLPLQKGVAKKICKDIQTFLNNKDIKPDKDKHLTDLLTSINTQIEESNKEKKDDTLMTSLSPSNSGADSS